LELIKIEQFGTELIVKRGDITNEPVDVIVNAANERLAGGGGVDGAIHRAGGPGIMEECRKIGRCPTGSVVATTAGRMAARRVYHTVGPIWRGGDADEARLLASCYRECLNLVVREGWASIAFPGISTGVYSYPPDGAAEVALATVSDFLSRTSHPALKEIRFILFDERAFQIYAARIRTN
jgi:O-acetyl-ADP-ribose deacetylase (regulator of RNase III)